MQIVSIGATEQTAIDADIAGIYAVVRVRVTGVRPTTTAFDAEVEPRPIEGRLI